jgi:hypothetical protein
MDESEGDENCTFVVLIVPKSPTRMFTFQRAEPGAKKWSTVKAQRVSSGKASFAVTEVDRDDMYLDGKYSYRVTAPLIKGKEKAFTSATVKIEFIRSEAADDVSDDFEDDSAASPTTARPSTTTTPRHSTGTPNVTTTTLAAGTNGGTPTNTTAPNNEDPNWWGGLAPTVDNLGAFCEPTDPTMYVGATICSASGIGGRKSVSQFKSLLSSISNAAPQYKRNGFCTQAMGKFGYSRGISESKCAEAGAGR